MVKERRKEKGGRRKEEGRRKKGLD